MTFSYNEHITLAKKIINYSDPKTKAQILKMPKPKNIIFPFLDFIYLSEEEKEKYFSSGIISYFGTNSIDSKDNFINTNNKLKSGFKSINNYINNYQFNNIFFNIKDNLILSSIFCKKDNINFDNYNYTNLLSNQKNISMSNNLFEENKFHNLIDNPIKHIFLVEPFYSKIKNFPLKRVEFLKGLLKKIIKTLEFYLRDV